MSHQTHRFFFLIILLLSVSSSGGGPYAARPMAFKSSETQILDISTSLQLAIQVLTYTPLTTTTLDDASTTEEVLGPLSSSSSSSVSFPLHTRHSLHPHNHKSYRDLTLSRLERDASRVDSLNSKLDFTLSPLNRSDLLPLNSEISTPIVSGTSQGSGEYFSRVGIGSPAKQMSLVIDTGSDISWLQCQPCTDCYSQTDPIFDPTASSTYAPVTCSSTQCLALETSACRTSSQTCLYQVSYGDGSYTVGDFATETVSFGTSGGSVNNVALGCGHDNEGLFVGSAGLLGLGGGSLSLPSQIKATAFSYCLVDRDSSSSSTLEFNSARPSDSVVTQLTKNTKVDTFFYVGMTGMSVGGNALSISPSLFQVDESGKGGIIVDSGTAVTRLRTEAYDALRDAFKSGTTGMPTASGVALFDTCYNLAGMTTVRVPTVAFVFAGGKSVNLPAKNYLIPVDESGTFCFAFAPTSSSLSIIGNVQQQGTRVSFDLANSQVGFSPNKC